MSLFARPNMTQRRRSPRTPVREYRHRRNERRRFRRRTRLRARPADIGCRFVGELRRTFWEKLFRVNKLADFLKTFFADAVNEQQVFDLPKRPVSLAVFDDLSCEHA